MNRMSGETPTKCPVGTKARGEARVKWLTGKWYCSNCGEQVRRRDQKCPWCGIGFRGTAKL